MYIINSGLNNDKYSLASIDALSGNGMSGPNPVSIATSFVWILDSSNPQPLHTIGIWTDSGLWKSNSIWYS